MTTEIFTPAAILVGAGSAIVRRSRSIVPLAVALLAIFTASAQAHTVTATATCKSVTFDWAIFSSSGNGNGGLNTPVWVIVFRPTSGSTTTLHGMASFPGSSYSLTVAIPSGNGVVTASSSWSSAETRDGNSNSVSKSLTIADCPVVKPPPPVTPPPPVKTPPPVKAPPPVTLPPAATPPSPVAHPSVALPVPATLALSTRASAAATLGGGIRDTAVLSGGSSPTGTITFSLYSGSDLTCSKALRTVTVAVSGNGSYASPPVTPASAGSYQWVAVYGGDANNKSLSTSCDDPAERSTVTQAVCVRPQAALRGFTETVLNSLFAYVPARGVESVTFYLDRRKLVTLTKPSHKRFSVAIDVRRLSFGVHRLTAKVTMRSPSCASAEVAGTFIHVKTVSLAPRFAG
jgi:hypothetical protein